jgi:GT2 family glycosyltransferase
LPALRANDSVEAVVVYTDAPSASAGESNPALLNHAVQGTSSDVLLFLDEEVEPLTDNWLDELLLWIEQPGIGVVGGKLLYPDGRLHQGCLMVGLQGVVGRLFHGMESGSDIFGRTEWYRNCLAVGGECLMIRRDLFTTLGGFDEGYQRGGHDVDLCLRVFQQGRRIVHNPLAAFRYHGPFSETVELGEADRERLRRRSGPFLRAGDPYFNDNLSRQSAQPRFRAREEGVSLLPPRLRARAG